MKFVHRYVPFFVWSVFALLLLLVLRFVHVYGVNLPFWDEWESIIPQVGKTVPISWEWLWSPWNEHRLLLPRLLMLGVLGVTGINFKAVMFFNVLLLASGCALILLAIGRVRAGGKGYRWSVTDAFFPILFLHTGHWENLTWAFQIPFFSGVFLIALLLFFAVTRNHLNARGDLSPYYVAPLALILVALALTGGNGLVYAPIGAICLISIGISTIRGADRRKGGWLAVGAGLAVMLLFLFYFHGLRTVPPVGDVPVTISTIIETAANYLSVGFGRGVHPSMEDSRTLRILSVCSAVGLAVGTCLFSTTTVDFRRRILLASASVALFAVVGVLLARAASPRPFELFTLALVPFCIIAVATPVLKTLRDARTDTETRRRILWIGVVICGTLLAAVAVGKGRAMMGVEAGFATRYGILSAQLLVALYFAAVLLRRGSFAERFVPLCLFAMAIALLPANRHEGKVLADSKRRMLSEFERWAGDGVSLPVLSALSNGLQPHEISVKSGIEGLRSQGHPLFVHTPDSEVLRRRDLSAEVLRIPRRLVFGNAKKSLLILLPPEEDGRLTRSIVVRYNGYNDFVLLSNYRLVALRRTASGFVEQGEPAKIPNPDFGAVLLQPAGPVDAIEIRPVPHASGGRPADINIIQVSLFQDRASNAVADEEQAK